MAATTELPHLWLRAEVKPQEGRVPITPNSAASLVKAGFRITVEKSEQRVFGVEEYAAVGCSVAEEGQWEREEGSEGAPNNEVIVVGLKELPEPNPAALRHTHVLFGHCFKEQTGWRELLARFERGGGRLLDLEFLTDENGRRVAAFGRPAGLVGCALGLLRWAQLHSEDASSSMAAVKPWRSEEALFEEVREQLKAVKNKGSPRVLIIGALGRCGGGAMYTVQNMQGLASATGWDLEETKEGGPFDVAVTDYDILVNCIYLRDKITPFVDNAALERNADKRRLSVFVDVSCDYTSPYNPFPIYHQATTVFQPTVRILPRGASELPLEVVSIDHLPSLLPADSSNNYAEQMLPHFLNIGQYQTDPVWGRALAIFHEKRDAAQKKDNRSPQ